MSTDPISLLPTWDRATETVAGFDDADHAEDGDEPVIAPLLGQMRDARTVLEGLLSAARALEKKLPVSPGYANALEVRNFRRALAKVADDS